MAMPFVIVITGASRGYGLALVNQLFAISEAISNSSAHSSIRILGTARSTPALEGLKHRYQNRFDYVNGDITEEQTWVEIERKCQKLWQRVDCLVLNAGALEPLGRIDEILLQEIKKAVDINLYSSIGLTQYLLPHLRKSKGKLIAISSGAATKAYSGWSAYCIAKAGLNMFVKSIAVEEPDVWSISIRPGVLDTDMQRVLREKGASSMTPDNYKRFMALYEQKMLVRPEDSAKVVAGLMLATLEELKELPKGEMMDWTDERVDMAVENVLG